jgi:hypothetical protein
MDGRCLASPPDGIDGRGPRQPLSSPLLSGRETAGSRALGLRWCDVH